MGLVDGVFDHRAYSEKALARLVRAKIKAIKHARTRSPNPSAGPSTSADAMVVDINVEDAGTATPIAAPGSATPRPGSPALRPMSPVHPGTPPILPGSPSIRPTSPGAPVVPVPSRTELLRAKPEFVGRYIRLMVPVLVDVYAASVATQTRSKSLTGILKAVSFAEGEEVNAILKVSLSHECFVGSEIKDIVQGVPVATFVGSILSSREYPTLTICALQLVELLLIKAPTVYKPALRREGVLHEIEVLADRPLTTKTKEAKTEEGSSRGKAEDLALARAKLEEVRVKQEEGVQVHAEPKISTSSPSPAPEPSSERDESPNADREREEREKERHVIPIPVKRSSNTVLDPQDAITLRAKIVRFKYMSGGEESTSDPVFERLRGLLATLRDPGAGEMELRNSVKGIAALFAGGAGASVSSYELLKSGLVEGLLHFTTDTSLSREFFFSLVLVMLTGMECMKWT